MKNTAKKITIVFVAVLLGLPGAQLFATHKTSAALVQNRKLTLSTSVGSASNVTYNLSFATVGTYNLGSIAIEFCLEDPLPYQPCTLPPGMVISGAAVGAQSGAMGFSVSSIGTNKIILGRAPATVTNQPIAYDITGITNPDIANKTYYSRIYTYTSNNGSGPAVDEGGLTFAITNLIALSTEVPPYIRFCIAQVITGLDCTNAAGYLVDVGELSRFNPKTGEAQMLMSTNAGYGAGVTISGTTLQSGNNIIPALAVPSGQTPGQSQFGINLRNNTNPNVGSDPVGPGVAVATASYNTPNQFKFVTSDQIVSTATATDLKKFTISFVTNISQNQAAGVYNTTLSFICLANF